MTEDLLHWDARYLTGIEEVDFQHHYFLDLINRLSQELKSTEDLHYRQRLIAELVKYAEFHFLSEENLMMRDGYPGLAVHHGLHLQLVEELSSRSVEQSLEELLDFLVRWFTHHTVEEDGKYGRFVAARRGAAPVA